jgi:hypothetical protein
VKLEPLSLTAINSTHRVGRGNKIHARKKGPEPGSVYTQSGAMKDVFARCHEKTDVQVCTLTIVHCCPVAVNIRAIVTYAIFYNRQFSSLCMYESVTVTLTDVYFRRLKINHDTHECILDSSTIANTYMYHSATSSAIHDTV